MRVCAPILALALLAACAAPAAQPDLRSAQTLPMTLEIIDSEHRRLPSGLQSAPFAVEFAFITGALFGQVDTDTVLEVSGRPGQTVDIDLAKLRSEASRVARSLRPGALPPGVQLQPLDAEIARVATGADGGAAAGLIDAESRAGLLLVYFDRPCRIYGTMRDRDAESIVDVAIPSAGMHWIRTRRISDKQFQTDTVATPRVVIGLQLEGKP